MVAIGDVFGVVAALLGVGVTAWALMVCCGLFFPYRVDRGRIAVEKAPWACIGTGALMLLPGLIGAMLLGSHRPAGVVAGWTLILLVLGVGAIGAAGLGHLAGRNLTRMAPEMPEYPAFVRGSAFLVTASMLPILGWFAFGPLTLLASLGAGIRAVLAPAERARAAEIR